MIDARIREIHKNRDKVPGPTQVPLESTLQETRGFPINAYLENEAVLQDEASDTEDEHQDQWEDQAPNNNDAPWLWQLHQFRDLEACEVVDGKERQEHLTAHERRFESTLFSISVGIITRMSTRQ